MCVGRDAVWLVEGGRHGGAAQSGQGPSWPRHQREGLAETDPETYGVYDPALCKQQRWLVHISSALSMAEVNTPVFKKNTDLLIQNI